ncbi:type VI immunity family protein [Roseinatronobacter alkalisoli]|uniref:DUF3396 domain-containing protein n=1 Tax=Roseinatronobacter alkalisoli TaxID=3028235 RepID=A0ABT5TF37_9RHOB|nr:type VI immunity family protein [Roseinatronobacter sp. HJB301]MDD7973736.1 DUF3396 domain-containing protein [Roseinatronobacter sp. HJB301]
MDEKNEYYQLHGQGIGHRKTNRPILRFAGTGLFYHNGVQGTDFERIIDAAQDFIDTFPGTVTKFADAGRGDYALIKGNNWRDRSGYRPATPVAADGFDLWVFSDENQPVISFSTYLPVNEGPYRVQSPGLVYNAVPLVWIAEDPDRCVAKMARWCALLRPEQGTFGIGTVSSLGTSQRNYGMEYWPWLARYSGLDAVTWMKYDRRNPHQALRAVNWLTILDDVWIDKLGGLERIAGSLHPEGSVYPYDGGAIIRACTHPQMGDVNMTGVPEAYVMVDRLIRPFRYTDYASGAPMDRLKVPEPLDPVETTVNWVRRFERFDPDAGGR